MKPYLLLVLAAVAAGCAPALPHELRNARVAYERASTSPNAALVPTEMKDAHEWLARAESEYSDTGDSEWSRDIAYIAQRRALAAEAEGEAARAKAEQQQGLAMLEGLRQKREALGMDAASRGGRTPMTESERRARTVANAQTLDTLSKIQDIKATATDRGLKLVMPGEILFASGQSEILGTARDRLNQVAIALKDDPRHIVIVGHTDDRGAEGVNQRISERRAVEVKRLFVKDGVAEDRIDARGVGPAQPIAPNDSIKGRAQNRRVEITLED